MKTCIGKGKHSQNIPRLLRVEQKHEHTDVKHHRHAHVQFKFKSKLQKAENDAGSSYHWGRKGLLHVTAVSLQ